MKLKTLTVLPPNVGKRGKPIVPPHGDAVYYIISDEIRVSQSDMPQKILCLQRIEFQEDKRI
jgi:hypothetical protein